MTLPNPKSVSESYRARQFANVLSSIVTHETQDQRWLRLAAEKLERDQATDSKEADRG